jgi:hypothetical protein
MRCHRSTIHASQAAENMVLARCSPTPRGACRRHVRRDIARADTRTADGGAPAYGQR